MPSDASQAFLRTVGTCISGRAGTRVGERVRAAARDIHHAPWPAAGHRGPGVRPPALPVARGPDPRFEGEQVGLVLPDPGAG
jgi:hypothetical protein